MAFPATRRAWLAVALAGGLVSSGAAGQTGGSTEAPPAAPPAERQAGPPPAGLLRISLQLIQQGRYDQARVLLEPLVAEHPGWARAHFFLALTYHEEQRYALARDLFERAVQLDPQYDTVRAFYGWCLYYLGELPQARAMFEAFLVARPNYPDAIFALGLIDFDDDDIDSARSRFEEAIRLASETQDASTEAKARARLADVRVRTGDLEAARTELKRSIELNPGNYETYFKLSRVLDRLGDAEGAEQARRLHEEVRQQVRPSAGSVPPQEQP